MRLDAFLLADSATTVEGKLFILGGGVTRLTVPDVPTGFPLLAVVARFRADHIDDLRETHFVRFRMESPDGDLVVDIESIELAAPGAEGAEEEELYGNLVLSFGPVVLPVIGLYDLGLWVDGELVRTMKLPVGIGASSA